MNRKACAIGCAIVLGALGGCYRHVVEVRGPVSGSYQVYEPNLDESEPSHSRHEKVVPHRQHDVLP